jgi:peptide deformylase
MAQRKILFIPDPRLRETTQTVETFDETLQALIADMFETMYAAKGVGLAAPQIGVSLKLAVIDTSRDQSEQLVIVNPEVTAADDIITMTEGCLSVPGTYDEVKRARQVTVKAQDRTGQPIEITAEDLLAEVLQHEIDHLNSTLYIDQLSSIKQQRAKKRVAKYKRALKYEREG